MPSGHVPVRDDRQRNRRGEDPDAIGQRAGHEEHGGRRAPRRGPEAALEPLVGGVLGALEVAREQQGGDADPSHQIPERDLEKREVAARGDPRDGDHRDGGRFRRDHRQHQRPPGQAAVAQEVVAGVALPPGEHQPGHQHGGAIQDDDG